VLLRLLARALRATHLIDRAFLRFSRARSALVLSHASGAFYDVYNDVAYGDQGAYRLGSEIFRTGLFPWEARAIARHFPPPPARILIGAAGGGREALALAEQGYAVTACEPAQRLAVSMRLQIGSSYQLRVFTGRYEGLPFVETLDEPRQRVDLRTLGPFDAVILGWASLSHLRTDDQAVAALRALGSLTAGPLLVSYFARKDTERAEAFSVDLGYYREFSDRQFEGFAARAGLHLVERDHESGWPNAVLRPIAAKEKQAGPSGDSVL
jgi:hypothetical protein